MFIVPLFGVSGRTIVEETSINRDGNHPKGLLKLFSLLRHYEADWARRRPRPMPFTFFFFSAGGANGAIAWGEAPQSGAQPRVMERKKIKPWKGARLCK